MTKRYSYLLFFAAGILFAISTVFSVTEGKILMSLVYLGLVILNILQGVVTLRRKKRDHNK